MEPLPHPRQYSGRKRSSNGKVRCLQKRPTATWQFAARDSHRASQLDSIEPRYSVPLRACHSNLAFAFEMRPHQEQGVMTATEVPFIPPRSLASCELEVDDRHLHLGAILAREESVVQVLCRRRRKVGRESGPDIRGGWPGSTCHTTQSHRRHAISVGQERHDACIATNLQSTFSSPLSGDVMNQRLFNSFARSRRVASLAGMLPGAFFCLSYRSRMLISSSSRFWPRYMMARRS